MIKKILILIAVVALITTLFHYNKEDTKNKSSDVQDAIAKLEKSLNSDVEFMYNLCLNRYENRIKDNKITVEIVERLCLCEKNEYSTKMSIGSIHYLMENLNKAETLIKSKDKKMLEIDSTINNTRDYCISVIRKEEEKKHGYIYFDDKEDCVTTKNIRVFQVIDDNRALALEEGYGTSIIMLVTNKEGKYYYDKQLISIPEKKCARQIGIYKYTSVKEEEKTVPIVIIDNKQ